MYTFNHVSSTPVSRPRSSARSCGSTGGETGEMSNDRIVDLVQRQNQLIIELLGKQDCMTSAIEEVKQDLNSCQQTHGGAAE